MAETNSNDQALRDQNARLEKQLDSLQTELAGLRNKDTEAALARLQKDVADRDALITQRDQTIASLNTQLEAIKDSSRTLQERLDKAEADLKVASEAIAKQQAEKVAGERLVVLKKKGAEDAVAKVLVARFSHLDDAAFTETVDIVSASWKKADAKTKVDPVVAAVQQAKVDDDPALATASEDQPEATRAAIVDFMGNFMRQGRGVRPSVFTTANPDA